MQSSQLVSVILPTYNRAHLLLRAIESVLGQTYPYWELIIWDDGSTDNTGEIINSYHDERIRYFSGENHGVSYARNRAIEVSKGTYLAFLDSDDEWSSDKLSVQVEVMRSNSNIDAVFTDFLNINLVKNEKHAAFKQNLHAMGLLDVEHIDSSLFIIKGGFLKGIALDNFVATDSVLLRRSLLERVGGFDQRLKNSNDFELWWRMGLAKVCFAYIDEIYVTRYKPPGSLSSPSLSQTENRLRALDMCLHNALEKGREDLVPYLECLYRNSYQHAISLYAAEGDSRRMFGAFFKSLRYGVSLGSFRLLFE